jgi:hypothetical protein
LATAGAKNRIRQFDTRNTSPPGLVNTRASRPFPTIAAERTDDLVNLLDRESHLAVMHSGLVLCRQQ